MHLIDWRAGYMEIAAQRGFSTEFLDCFRRVTVSHGCACGRALLMRESVLIEDVATDALFTGFRGVAERAGFAAVQSTPLISSGGALVGMISTHGGRLPSRQQLGLIRGLAEETANTLIRLRMACA